MQTTPRCCTLLALLLLVEIANAQSTTEPVDRDMVAKIQEEGLKKSQVMETISHLTDVYGPRLTGSPQTKAAGEWAQKKLSEWGLADARCETWGEFGRGWTLEGFTANMLEPSFAPLIAYPKAWSPSTPTVVRGEPIYLDADTEEELDKFRGKLHRAIVLLAPPRNVPALFDPLARRQSDEYLLGLANSDGSFRGRRSSAAANDSRGAGAGGANAGSGNAGPSGSPAPSPRTASQLLGLKWQLIYDEGAAVVLEPGRGDGGTVFVGAVTLPRRAAASAKTSPREESTPYSRGPRPWAKDAPAAIPQVVVAVEHYNRCIRLLEKGVPLQLEIDIAAQFHAEDLSSFNVLAEIPGSDLKDEVVMLGAHFDSWHTGTGATDNAVGCGVAMEVVRILQAVGAKPRRTIRIALWTGEEQGLLGSRAYVAQQFGRSIPRRPSDESGRGEGDERRGRNTEGGKLAVGGPPGSGAGRGDSTDPDRAADNERRKRPERREPVPRYELKPAHDQFAAYFNLDNGTGKIRGVYLQGNETVRPIFRAWLTPFAELGAATLTTNNTSGTDHLSFHDVGLPGFQFIQDPLEYDTRTHHSNMDVYERVQEEDMKQAAVIMASFVYHAATRSEKLPRRELRGEIVRLPSHEERQ